MDFPRFQSKRNRTFLSVVWFNWFNRYGSLNFILFALVSKENWKVERLLQLTHLDLKENHLLNLLNKAMQKRLSDNQRLLPHFDIS